MWLLHTRVSIRLQDTATLILHQVLEIDKVSMFLRPEEAMFENWQKLVFHWIIFLFLRYNLILHWNTQNKKHQPMNNKVIFCMFYYEQKFIPPTMSNSSVMIWPHCSDKICTFTYGSMKKCSCLHGNNQSNMNHTNVQPLPTQIKLDHIIPWSKKKLFFHTF